MTRLRVPVYYDFASSLCYVAHRVLERLAPELEQLELDLDWTPVDLTRISGWRRGSEIGARARANVERVSRELDVPLRIPPRWLDSRRANAVALALRDHATREATWRERVWTAIYEEGREADAPGELERWLAELDVRVDPRALGRPLDALEVNTELARDVGISGVPSLLLDGWPLAGIQEEQTMRTMLARYARRKRESAPGQGGSRPG